MKTVANFSVMFFMAMILVCASAEAGDRALSTGSLEARKALADLLCPEMFVFYAQKGNQDMVKLFLAAGMDVNARVKGSGNTALMQAANAGRLDTVKLLMENGADINMANEKGETALTKASSTIDDEADDIISNNGRGEISIAKASSTAEMESGRKEVLKLLLSKGARGRIR